MKALTFSILIGILSLVEFQGQALADSQIYRCIDVVNRDPRPARRIAAALKGFELDPELVHTAFTFDNIIYAQKYFGQEEVKHIADLDETLKLCLSTHD